MNAFSHSSRHGSIVSTVRYAGPLGLAVTLDGLETETELSPELLAHETVEDEIGGTIDECQEIPNFCSRIVVAPKEFGSIPATKKMNDPLGKFCQKEQAQNSHQHS